MNQFIIIAIDSLRAVGTNACYPDTIVCKMISSHETSSASINYTLVIIIALITVVFLAWIISDALLRCKKINSENKSHYVDLLLAEYAKKNTKEDAITLLKKILKKYSRTIIESECKTGN